MSSSHQEKTVVELRGLVKERGIHVTKINDKGKRVYLNKKELIQVLRTPESGKPKKTTTKKKTAGEGKPKRKLTPYNEFLSKQIIRVRTQQGLRGRQAFKKAVAHWNELKKKGK